MFSRLILAKIVDFVKAQLALIKTHETSIILAIGVALVSLLSFAAGYLTAEEKLKEPIRIEKSQDSNLKSQTNFND